MLCSLPISFIIIIYSLLFARVIFYNATKFSQLKINRTTTLTRLLSSLLFSAFNHLPLNFNQLLHVFEYWEDITRKVTFSFKHWPNFLSLFLEFQRSKKRTQLPDMLSWGGGGGGFGQFPQENVFFSIDVFLCFSCQLSVKYWWPKHTNTKTYHRRWIISA